MGTKENSSLLARNIKEYGTVSSSLEKTGSKEVQNKQPMPQTTASEISPINIEQDPNEIESQAKKKNLCSRAISKQFYLRNSKIGELISYSLILFLTWSLLYLFLHKEVLPGGDLFKLMVLILIASIVGYLFTLVKLPALLGMLITGVVLKTVGFYSVSGVYTEIVIISRNVAMTVILIKAGLGLDPEALMRLKFTVLKLSLLPCIAESIAAGVLCHYILSFPWSWSFLLGFLLCPISPAVVVPTLLNLKERGYGESKGIATLVIAASSIDDIFSISAFGVVLSTIFSVGSLTFAMIRGPVEVIAGLILGIIWGLICGGFPLRNSDLLTAKRAALVGLGGVIFVLGSIELDYPGSGPLGCITAAFVANLCWKIQNGKDGEPSPVSHVYSAIWLMVQPILFGLIGTEIDLLSLDIKNVGYGIAIVCGALVFRGIVCFGSLLGGVLNYKEMLFVNLAWLPKATVQAALGPQPLDYLRSKGSTDAREIEMAEIILTTAVLSILITAPIGAVAIAVSGPRLLSKEPKLQPVK